MLFHDKFLHDLLSIFPRVSLVARYADEALDIPDYTFRVFIPDLHWISPMSQSRYTGYRFNGTAPPHEDGRPMFTLLVALLLELQRNGADLEVYQLGDRYDLWRELNPGDSLQDAYHRIRTAPLIEEMADRLDQLGTVYLRGNHDFWMGSIEAEVGERTFEHHVPASSGGRIYLTHGHEFDNVELLPDSFQQAVLAHFPRAKSATYQIGPSTRQSVKALKDFLAHRRLDPDHLPGQRPPISPDGARLIRKLEDLETICETMVTFLDTAGLSVEGQPNDFDQALPLSFGDKIYWMEKKLATSHRLFVHGHTHRARIMVIPLPDRPPVVVMDCGAWVENCEVRHRDGEAAHVEPSAQIGVQCGNDVRIYQLAGSG